MVRRLLRPLLIAGGVTGLSAIVSYLVPAEYSASAVGFVFLGATYWLCLREPRSPRIYGLALGGLMESAPLEPGRLLRETMRALAVALFLGFLIFPLFYWAFLFWHRPTAPFSLSRMAHALSGGRALGYLDLGLGHLLAVALPEEAFFRGYLQSELARKTPTSTFRAQALAIFLTSVIFALGHFLTFPHPARLAVFFPSLAFGVLRARTGGIGASVLFHALCNLYSAALFAGFQLA
jgi:uncharacterized protein